jgi:anti-sigma factor RsiW
MNNGFDRHFPYHVWEDYAMGALSHADGAPVEKHLLICSACQHLVAEADEYIEIVKAALTLAGTKAGRQRLVTDSRTRRRLSKSAAAAATHS